MDVHTRATSVIADAFFAGGRGFYTQTVDAALTEIDRLPGRHLYFLDDHLLGHKRFARALFDGLTGAGRVWQAAGTVKSVLEGDLIERAAAAGLRSLFVGFESANHDNLEAHGKSHNIGQDYDRAIDRLHDLGVMVNASFVFGMDADDKHVFDRTVEWAISHGIETATFHILTPYPGTGLYDRMASQGRLLHSDWDRYDTRHVVFRPKGMTQDDLVDGYWRAYKQFYTWRSITAAASTKPTVTARVRHFAYAAGWKKFEPTWDVLIRLRRMPWLLPVLERVLSSTGTIDANAAADAHDPSPTSESRVALTTRAISHVEADLHDVTVGDLVVLAFDAQLADLARLRPRADLQ